MSNEERNVPVTEFQPGQEYEVLRVKAGSEEEKNLKTGVIDPDELEQIFSRIREQLAKPGTCLMCMTTDSESPDKGRDEDCTVSVAVIGPNGKFSHEAMISMLQAAIASTANHERRSRTLDTNNIDPAELVNHVMESMVAVVTSAVREVFSDFPGDPIKMAVAYKMRELKIKFEKKDKRED